jgi:hypothetical protein
MRIHHILVYQYNGGNFPVFKFIDPVGQALFILSVNDKKKAFGSS